ncbi:MAG: fabF 2 [Bacteroidota bacterium]|nr:fabF 2 [Bacteroidota bacterium]
MHADIFIKGHNIISPLGISSEENFKEILKGNTGVKLHNRIDIDDEPFYASLIDDQILPGASHLHPGNKKYTRFETLLIASIKQALETVAVDMEDKKTILIFSSTKGNIALLEKNEPLSNSLEEISLFHSAKLVTELFKNPNTPVVISNACISGIAALIYAKRLLSSGAYENAVVVGGDNISKFIFSGFKSFRALSNGVCKPFSADRDGINLGEAASTVILSTQSQPGALQLKGGAIRNDANHISGPSKTGVELSSAIDKALSEANILSKQIDFISAHGTATPFNDEMEAKSFYLSKLYDTPVNSFKGYFGHTLGAAGLVESVIGMMSLQHSTIIPTFGFTNHGVSVPVNICAQQIHKPMHSFLKTASGFGGCNAAVVFSNSN